MKFDNVRKTTELYYQRMIDIFLSDKDNRFSAAVVNKENPTFIGAISIESHSNMLMQLCDVLLGAVMYDYKKKSGMTSSKIEARKENLVKKIRNVLKIETLAKEIVDKSLVHFSVNE